MFKKILLPGNKKLYFWDVYMGVCIFVYIRARAYVAALEGDI